MIEHQPAVSQRIDRRGAWATGRAVLVSVTWAVSVVVVVAGGLLTVTLGGPGVLLTTLGLALAAISFATVGAILVTRLPVNVIGWLLAFGGLCFALGSGSPGLAHAGLDISPGSVPGAIWFAWFNQWIWAPALGTVVLLALVYPTGRLLSTRWRPVAVGTVVVIVVLSADAAAAPGPLGSFPAQNPFVIGGWVADVFGAFFGPALVIGALVALLAVVSLVLRYRRAAGIERAQLRWFAAVAAFSVPAIVVGTATYGMDGAAGVASQLANFASFLGFALLPIAIGIAILRYRLYEIDRIISRTIGWALVSAVLAAVFVVGILTIQAALAQVTSSNTFAVAASTLVVAALFQPLRQRVQARVDRRFNRARYDAERTVAAFVGRLRDEVDLGQLDAEIMATVARTVQPTSVSLWLRR